MQGTGTECLNAMDIWAAYMRSIIKETCHKIPSNSLINTSISLQNFHYNIQYRIVPPNQHYIFPTIKARPEHNRRAATRAVLGGMAMEDEDGVFPEEGSGGGGDDTVVHGRRRLSIRQGSGHRGAASAPATGAEGRGPATAVEGRRCHTRFKKQPGCTHMYATIHTWGDVIKDKQYIRAKYHSITLYYIV
jgi:hypothetical protein